MKLIYVSKSDLGSTEANAVHVAHMCDAFADAGWTVELLATGKVDAAMVRKRYGLRHVFEIRGQTPLGHVLWIAGRRLSAPPSQALYFGRRFQTLARLAAYGYPVGAELHKPPRKAAHRAALETLTAAPSFRGLVVISEQLKAEMLRLLPRLPAARVLVAHDGVRAAQIREPQLNAHTRARAVYCGSLHPGKGMETLLPAASLCPEVDFDVIGGSPEQVAALRAKAPANLRLLGWQPHEQAMASLGGYDIALAPYGHTVRGVRTPAHDSLASWMSPLKIFEYMGAGLPIVTTDLPVLHEILIPDVNACLVPPEEPQALAAAVRSLAADPGRRLAMAQSAQRSLGQYTWESRARLIGDFLVSGGGA